jgi:hypothetical protein
VSEPTAFSLQLSAFPSCRVLTADCAVRNRGRGKSCCRDRSRSSPGCRSKNGAWAMVKSSQRGKGWSWGWCGGRSEDLSEAKAGAWSGRRGRARSRRWCGTMGRGWCEDWSRSWNEGRDSGKGSVWCRRWSRDRSGVRTGGCSGAKGSPSHGGDSEDRTMQKSEFRYQKSEFPEGEGLRTRRRERSQKAEVRNRRNENDLAAPMTKYG